MLIDIDRIVVNDRIRKDFGDIEELADDIRTNGLINPPTINKNYVLLAGERRLMACKLLGWSQIEVHMIDTRDEAHDLAVEMSENNMRRNFTGSELAAGIRRQMELESAKARERMQDPMQTFAEGQKGTARDKAAEHFGISGEQARKTVFVDEHRDLLDPADFADWDEGRLSTNKAFQRIKAAQAKAEQERDAARAEVATVRRVGDKLKSDLDDARAEIEALEHQNDELYALAQQSQVIEREVVRNVVPEDYEDTKRRARELEGSNRLYSEDNERLRRQLEEASEKLEQASTASEHDWLLDNAVREIEAFKSRFGALDELAEVIAAMDKFLNA